MLSVFEAYRIFIHFQTFTLLERLQDEMESQNDSRDSDGNTEDEMIKELMKLIKNITGVSLNSKISTNSNENVSGRKQRNDNSSANGKEASSSLVIPKNKKGKSQTSNNISNNIGKNRFYCESYDTDSEEESRRKFFKSSKVDFTEKLYSSSDESPDDQDQINRNKYPSTLIPETDYSTDWLVNDVAEGTPKRKKRTQSVTVNSYGKGINHSVTISDVIKMKYQ